MSAGLNREAEAFLWLLGAGLPRDERLIICGFRGDPEAQGPTAWRPRPWWPGRDQEFPLCEGDDAYVTVSSFRVAADGSWRRRGECFAAGRALMVDDVGTKVDPAVVAHMEPTARVETSPGNFQYWYMLREPLADRGRFDGMIRAFIAGRLAGADPGMAGVTRVGRVPGFQNSKRKYGGWTVRLRSIEPARLFTVDDLLTGFKLFINGNTQIKFNRVQPPDVRERITGFGAHHAWLERRGMLKQRDPDVSGWMEMHCPWVGGHTGGADTGAALRMPSDENGYYGAFRCHHGHCADRGWAALTDWINDETTEELESINNGATAK